MDDRPPERRAPTPPPTRPPRVLVADDDRITRELLVAMLRRRGYVVDAVEDGQAAVERAARGDVDIVLLDIMMPRLSGIEACRILKGLTHETFLPVVLVTVKTDSQSRVEGLRIGADDYVCKPFDETELCARVEAMLRIKRLHDHVVESKKRLERMSVRDELTDTYNYRYLHARLDEEWKRAEKLRDPLSCALIDIDALKHENESSREAGDALIRGVAEVVKGCARESDVVARFGGDEFLVVMPATHLAGAVALTAAIWRGAQALTRADGGRVAVSIGVALFPSPDVRTKDALLRAADQALFHAKRQGGNRVAVFQSHAQIYAPALPDEPKAVGE